jgi:hypothetical protein
VLVGGWGGGGVGGARRNLGRFDHVFITTTTASCTGNNDGHEGGTAQVRYVHTSHTSIRTYRYRTEGHGRMEPPRSSSEDGGSSAIVIQRVQDFVRRNFRSVRFTIKARSRDVGRGTWDVGRREGEGRREKGEGRRNGGTE